MATPFAITPDILLQAYRRGIFPMADNANADELHWYDPPQRTIFPLDRFHVPHRLRRTIRQKPYAITGSKDFAAVIAACAKENPGTGRDTTWINREIVTLYTALHQQGYAHSIEAWHADKLVGGLYGVQIGGAFFGESMFSTATNASKICLVYLVAMLRRRGFRLLDCQFRNPHLLQFGAETISRDAYQRLLHEACDLQCAFPAFGVGGTGTDSGGNGEVDGLALAFLQESTHTS